jgi:signal transduction histidine kinase
MMATVRTSARRAERTSNLLWVATVLIALIGLVFLVIAWGDMIAWDAWSELLGAVAAVVYTTLGALIVHRSRNLVGWLLQGVGVGLAVLNATGAYAIAGISTIPGSLPAPAAVGAVGVSAFVLTNASIAFLLFFFPTGALPSPRWRPVLAASMLAFALTAVGFLLNPVRLALPAPGGALKVVQNPLGIESLARAISTVLVGTVWAAAVTVAAAFVALVGRFRRGGREVREQIKWVAFVAAVGLLGLFGATAALSACSCDNSPIANIMYIVVEAMVFLGLPAAIAIAILRYRLYEIDVIINRTVVYGLLAAALTIIYVGVVVGAGTLAGSRGNPLLTIAAAVAIAMAFQPLRDRARRLANRLVYGDRATPYQVLSDFAERVGGSTYGVDDVVQRMASVLGQGTGAARVDVWLRVGAELRLAASWPAVADPREPMRLGPDGALPPFQSVTRALAVRHDDEVLGALSLEKPRNEALTPTEDKLMQDLASQAGLVLRNVRLTAELRSTIDELRASRRRLVEAQDEERRKIERNLHDGAQQQLVALTVQLGLLERQAEEPDTVRASALRLKSALHEALEDLRALARGIYPPLLADQGLAAALEAQGRRATVPTTIDSDGIGRYPREVESAVYFCALEALQNVAKYAEATSVAVKLGERGGKLEFEIADDGRGFDPGETTYGTGMQGMVDRLDAIGGTLEIRSEPGHGTIVRGKITLS